MRIFRFCLFTLLLLIVALPISLFGTPFVPVDELDLQLRDRLLTQPIGANRSFPGELDELDEFTYSIEMAEILEWLTTLQVSDPGDDFGGMREGEEDLEIIQTDNTQEALRDWAHYGITTGDTSLFREPINNAWQTCSPGFRRSLNLLHTRNQRHEPTWHDTDRAIDRHIDPADDGRGACHDRRWRGQSELSLLVRQRP